MQNSNCFQIPSEGSCHGYDVYVPKSVFIDENNFLTKENEEFQKQYTYIQQNCPNIDIEKIKYKYSYICNILLENDVSKCNENYQKPSKLCKSTCEMFKNEILDPNNQCQDQIKRIVESECDFLNDINCINGQNEEISFSGYEKKVYCELDPTKEVCTGSFNSSSIGGENNMNSTGLNGLNEESGGGSGLTSFIIIILVMAVLGVGGLIIFNKRQQKKMMKNRSNEELMMDNLESNDQNYIMPPLNGNNINTSAMMNTSSLVGNELPLYKIECNLGNVGNMSGGGGNISVETPTTTTNINNENNNKIRVESISLYQGNNATAATEADSSSSSVPASLTNVYMIVMYQYSATLDDELTLNKNDRIKVEYEYDDGWGAGVNENTGEYGAFPLVCCKYEEDKNEKSQKKESSEIKFSLLKLPEEIENDMKKTSIFSASALPKRNSSVSFLESHGSIKKIGSRIGSTKTTLSQASDIHSRGSVLNNESHLSQIEEKNLSTSASTSESGSKGSMYSPSQSLIDHSHKHNN